MVHTLLQRLQRRLLTDWFSGGLLAARVTLRTEFLSGFDQLRGVSVRISRALLAAGFAPLLLAGLFAPIASAAVPLGGGAGIVVEGSYCTLATIGHDNSGELVGFTAAHCGGPGSPVVVEGTDTTVGTVVAANGDLDYAVIKFDPAAVTPTANFAGFAINGIGPDPEWHQPECRLGAATGDFCSHNGTIPGPGPHMSMGGGNYPNYLPGDNGAPVTSVGLLVGLVTGGFFAPNVGPVPLPPHQLIYVTKFSAILDDVNSTNGPGAGFVPIPA